MRRATGDRPACGVAFIVMLITGAAVSPAQQRVVTIQAARFVDAEGTLKEDAVVVVRDGGILRIGGNPPSGAEVVDFGDAVICAGLIDISSALGAAGNLSETAVAIESGVSAADAFDRFSAELSAALHGGVTAFALCPDDQNLVGGRISVCQTHSPNGAAALLSADGPLKLSLSSAVYKFDREPTSRSGAVRMLHAAIADAKSGGAPAADALGAFAQGRLGGIIAAPTGADVLAAAGLIEQFDLKLAIVHTHDAAEVAGEAARVKASMIVGPYDLYTPERDARAAGIFERAGLHVAIAGGLPGASANSLRLGAAVAVRHGMSPAAARRAITSVPAMLLGVDDRIGRLEQGRRADLVVFSGDPIDLRSRILAIYIGGEHVSHVAQGPARALAEPSGGNRRYGS